MLAPCAERTCSLCCACFSCCAGSRSFCPNLHGSWLPAAKTLCGVAQPPRFEFYDPQTPIYTSPRFLPPAKIVKSRISDAIVSHGSYLEECTVANAIVGLRSRIDKGAVIQVRWRADATSGLRD